MSSKIEGTQATFGEVLKFEAAGGAEGESEAKLADIREVLNYRAALRHGETMMRTLPLSQRVIREAHEVLMTGVRGQDKSPNAYRQKSNWIGPAGCTIENARFVPPSAIEVNPAMDAWEKYLHSNASDMLVQLAILHVEFESIHPFLDGNGRLGRLLVPLFLVEKKLLSSPNFYISAYFEQHREEYYERLRAVSRDGDWTGWCVFFLQAVLEQGTQNESKARAIIELYKTKKDWFISTTRSHHAITALDWFFNRPVFRVGDFVKLSGIPKSTANRIILLARDHKLLQDIFPATGSRAATLVFTELVNIAEGRKVL